MKTSGKKGLHVYAALDGRARFADSKALAKEIARELSAARPHAVTDRMTRAERGARVLIDWRQNGGGLSTVAPYSPRAVLPAPLVSTPISWDELAAAVDADAPERLLFAPAAVLARAATMGDLFATSA